MKNGFDQLFSGVNIFFTNIAIKRLFFGEMLRTRLRWVCPALKSDFSGEPCGLVSVSFTCQFTNEARFFRLFEFQS